MLQTLFHIPHEIGGVPMFGIGILLGVLVVGSLAALGWLWHSRKSLADARGFLPVVLMIGAAIVFLLPILEEARQGLPIRGYGVMMLLGVVCGVGLAAWRAPAARFDPEVIYALAFWMFVSGIVGARLFHVIEYWEQSYRQPTVGATLAAIVNVPRGGLVVYGSLIAVMIMLPWFVWRHKLPGLALCDLVAPSMVLGLALGRIGCLLNGCCYGGVSDIPWAITFPANSLPYRDQRQEGRLDDVKLALDAKGQVVVESVLGDAARKTGLKDGDAISAIEGKIDDVPIRLELGAKPKIGVVPASTEGKSRAEPLVLAPDVAPW
ncbi:MAG: prolipoprotein diacylglyceryl transferase, partial [Planctomycetes bacterium]|nr:prolipoprotein diacylglyceryl transferase [Planctomycetota bacterium]